MCLGALDGNGPGTGTPGVLEGIVWEVQSFFFLLDTSALRERVLASASAMEIDGWCHHAERCEGRQST